MRTASTAVLADCGSGVVSQLLKTIEPADLDAVVISHDHPDHWIDLVTLQMTLAYAPGTKRQSALPVYLGPGVDTTIRGVGEAMWTGFWSEIEFLTYDPQTSVEVGDVTISFAATLHSRPCWAMRFTHEGRSLVYTADTSPSEDVLELATGANTLLAESTLGLIEYNDRIAGHMTAVEAAQLADTAGVGHLLLTHFFVESQPEALLAAASEVCKAPVHIAKEGGVHDI